VFKAYMETAHGVQIGFAQWMMLGIPLVVISVPLVHLILTRLCFKVGREDIPGAREQLAELRAQLGRISWPEWAVMGAFTLAVTLWISREAWKVPAPKLPGEPWALGALLTDEVIA